MTKMKFLFFGVVSVYLQAISFAAEKSEYIPAGLQSDERESYERMLNYSIGSKVDFMYSFRNSDTEEGVEDGKEIQSVGFLNISRDKLQSMLRGKLDEVLETAKQDFAMWQIGRTALINEVDISAQQWLYEELIKREYAQSGDFKRIYKKRLKKLMKVFSREEEVHNLLARLDLYSPNQIGYYEGDEEYKILTIRKMCRRALLEHMGHDDPSIGQQIFVILELLDDHILDVDTQSRKPIPFCDRFHEFKSDMLQALLTTLVDEDGKQQLSHLNHILQIVTIRTKKPIDPLHLRQTWINEKGATILCPFPLGPYFDMFQTKLNITEIAKIRDAYENDTGYGFFTAREAVLKVACDEFYVPGKEPINVIRVLCGGEPEEASTSAHNSIAILLRDAVRDIIGIYKLAATDRAKETVERYEVYRKVIQGYVNCITTEND